MGKLRFRSFKTSLQRTRTRTIHTVLLLGPYIIIVSAYIKLLQRKTAWVTKEFRYLVVLALGTLILALRWISRLSNSCHSYVMLRYLLLIDVGRTSNITFCDYISSEHYLFVTHTHTHIYIYIYVCVCVCVCVTLSCLFSLYSCPWLSTMLTHAKYLSLPMGTGHNQRL